MSQIKFDGNEGRVLHSHLLISIRAIIDMDYGIIKYIAQEMPNNQIFDLDKFYDVEFFSLIKKLYERDYDNPLYYLAKPEIEKHFLDELRNELMEERQDKILDYSISTEIANAMDLWMRDQDIASINILYYTDEELKLLEEENFLKNFNPVSVNDAKKILKVCEQYFFFGIDEALPFIESKSNTFYFSKRRLNFTENEKGDLIFDVEKDPINSLMKYRNEISIFDLYREDVLNSESDDED